MTRLFALFGRAVLFSTLALSCALTLSRAGEPGAAGMKEVLILRFDDVERIDNPDGDLARFLAVLHNQGAPISPLQSAIGPILKNPFFSELAVGAWLEATMLAPVEAGRLSWVWVFPVDSQDRYLSLLMRQGLSDSEGVGDVSILSELDPNGNINYHYLEWLPDSIAVFGTDRAAVRAVKEIYEAAGASRGLLGSARGREIAPDVRLVFFPSAFAAWQDAEPGVYWWRTQVRRLTADLLSYWDPEPARSRLIQSLSEDFAALPMGIDRCEIDVWFDEIGVEWRLRLFKNAGGNSPLSELSTMRHMPDGSALAYGLAMDNRRFKELEELAGKLLLGAAGGAAPSGARDVAATFSKTLERAGLEEASVAWLPPPRTDPGFGSTRLLVSRWRNPSLLHAAWLVLEGALNSDGPVAAALSQLGWRVRLAPMDDQRSRRLIVNLSGREAAAKPAFDATFAARLDGPILSLAWGAVNDRDPESAALHRGGVADAGLAAGGGQANVRQAFTLVGSSGTSFMAVFSPVTFVRTVLAEAADWRIRTLDEEEPLSTRVAREMFEYGEGGEAWLAVGSEIAGSAVYDGRLTWNSLRALAVSIGLTDNMIMRGPLDEEE